MTEKSIRELEDEIETAFGDGQAIVTLARLAIQAIADEETSGIPVTLVASSVCVALELAEKRFEAHYEGAHKLREPAPCA